MTPLTSSATPAEPESTGRQGGDLSDVAAPRLPWDHLGATALTRHIEQAHHQYLRSELRSLVALADEVDRAQGAGCHEASEVHKLVLQLALEVIPHVAREDQVLFPAIRALADGHAGFGHGSVANPIARMVAEHEAVSELLSELRSATNGYDVPEGASASHRQLCRRLEVLEADTQLHMLKENSVLFPAAVALEKELGPRLAEG